MSQPLTIFRAARLIGVTRAAIQQKIKDGALPSSDGMVMTEDLLRAFPGEKVGGDAVVERLSRLKEEAFSRRVRERALPAAQVLAERLYEQSREVADLRAHLQRYHALVVDLRERMERLEASAPAPVREALAGLTTTLEEGLARVLSESTAPDELAMMDDMLKVMSAHVMIHPSRREFFVEGADTILDAAVRAGIPVNFGCSSGCCGLCKARVVSGQVRKVRHHDYMLSEAERQQGWCLLCSNAPVGDLVVEALEAKGPADIPEQDIVARVKAVQLLGGRTFLLHLQTPRSQRLRFLAGQSVTLAAQGCGDAVLPVASCPCDDRNLHFHVDRDAHGGFGERLLGGALRPGDAVTVRGPWGDFVLREGSRPALAFIACDSGFAPVKSLLEHSMAAEAAERTFLYRVATPAVGHYLENVCRAWSAALDNFGYTALAATPDDWAGAAAAVVERLLDDHPDFRTLEVYLAGPDGFVREVAELLLQRGLPESRLLACAL